MAYHLTLISIKLFVWSDVLIVPGKILFGLTVSELVTVCYLFVILIHLSYVSEFDATHLLIQTLFNTITEVAL